MSKIANIIELAKDEINAENYKEAEALLNDVLKEDRNQKEVWVLKARIAYHLNRGLASAYQYLTNAIKLSKNKDYKDIVDMFIWVSLKELKWNFNNAIERLPDVDEVNTLADVLDIFKKQGTELLNQIGDTSASNKVKNDFIKLAIGEIKKSWDKVAKEYYKDALSDYGKRWADTDYTSEYRPREYDFNTFVDSTALLATLSRYILPLQNEEADFDSLISLAELCITMYECASNACGYSITYEAPSTEINSKGKLVIYEGGEYWSVAIKNSDKVKEDIDSKRMRVYVDISTLKKNKEYAAKKLKEKRNAEYWDNHKDEAAQLLAEKDAALAHKKELIALYNKKNKELLTLMDTMYGSKENKSKLADLDNEIFAKKGQLQQLGLFKFKEKAALKEEINKLSIEFSKLQATVNKYKEIYKKTKSQEEKLRADELRKLEAEIKKCDEVIASIDKRFKLS